MIREIERLKNSLMVHNGISYPDPMYLTVLKHFGIKYGFKYSVVINEGSRYRILKVIDDSKYSIHDTKANFTYIGRIDKVFFNNVFFQPDNDVLYDIEFSLIFSVENKKIDKLIDKYLNSRIHNLSMMEQIDLETDDDPLVKGSSVIRLYNEMITDLRELKND